MMSRLRQLDADNKINDENAFKKGGNDNKGEQRKSENRENSFGEPLNIRGDFISIAFTEGFNESRKPTSAYRIPEHQAA